MSVLMGGSGSTGSSLVKNILNRHEALFSGEETSLFAKMEIYSDWKNAKNRLLKRKWKGLRNHGFHIYNGTDILSSDYLNSEKELAGIIDQSTSLIDFTARFYQKSLHLHNAKIWLEKTPANAVCFNKFLDHYRDGKIIHTIRNPYDTVASLWSRGYSLYYAVGIYLINTAAGLGSRKEEGKYLETKYESLVSDPQKEVGKICSFLNLQFSERLLQPQGENVVNPQLQGWNYDETGKIGSKAVGRFAKLSNEDQERIMEAFQMIRINKVGQQYYNTTLSSIEEICRLIDYDYYPLGSVRSKKMLKVAKRKDRIERIKRGYKTGIYYPLEIVK